MLIFHNSCGNSFVWMLENGCRGLLPFTHWSNSWVEQWCWTMGSGSWSAFQFRCWVRVKIWALYRHVLPHQTPYRISHWTLLSKQNHFHNGTEKSPPQTRIKPFPQYHCIYCRFKVCHSNINFEHGIHILLGMLCILYHVKMHFKGNHNRVYSYSCSCDHLEMIFTSYRAGLSIELML